MEVFRVVMEEGSLMKISLLNEAGESVYSAECNPDKPDHIEYWLMKVIDSIDRRLYLKEARLDDEELQQRWYRWRFYIDGENASEFLRLDYFQHTTHWQARCGAVIGWKYYKALKAAQFNSSTARMLAYARGYLAGMESNSAFDHEGQEALYILGLDVLEGQDLRE